MRPRGRPRRSIRSILLVWALVELARDRPRAGLKRMSARQASEEMAPRFGASSRQVRRVHRLGEALVREDAADLGETYEQARARMLASPRKYRRAAGWPAYDTFAAKIINVPESE